MVALPQGGGAKPEVAFDLPGAFGRRALNNVARAPFLSATPWRSVARGKAVIDVYERALDQREALLGYAEVLCSSRSARRRNRISEGSQKDL